MCIFLGSFYGSFPCDFFKRSLVEHILCYFLFCSILSSSHQFNPFCYHYSFLTPCNSVCYLLCFPHDPLLIIWYMGIPNEVPMSQDSKLTTNQRFKPQIRESIHVLFVFFVWVTSENDGFLLHLFTCKLHFLNSRCFTFSLFVQQLVDI